MNSSLYCTQGAHGATMDGVSPKFCTTNGLWDSVVDHHQPLEITLAAKKTLTVPTKTVYVNDVLVIEVPEGQDLILGMPWLKTNNPDIDWVKERPTKRRRAKNKVKTPRKPARPAVKIGGQK
ncbi:Hypothetical protein PHPALM_37411 [Phytophthora palmivora]|uniref:Uncharacterized protein n=1 Tax=Phytophthora palmivora TaxID=4796 RepID=A0A2P4WXI4_9STRA|nr:Hypothetical protein PHPALM_37411 [Phytophthora palmivora]